ncbi:putative deoxyuridine 5'-triphosphate nucleotidohydrolase YncF [Moorella sp. E308F]|uniref:dUTP diphosphatase n=1 Tax=Moorella sp. E308F TaxID=2572682 RepID=UPI0010FFC1FB|nr:dUTP diphosphatase [Moorella sp. E308F]GEA16813.1 putative deoxyuridine 5'-triphosphate nucleotidohydrolase YncF [Moorella sp. E308F]
MDSLLKEILDTKKLFLTAKMNYRRFDKTIPALYRDNIGNAGYDLFAREEVTLQPGEYKRIPLNVATEIPIGAVGLLFQRSSLFHRLGLRLTNGVGVIDASYRGDGDEWQAEFQNVTDEPVTVRKGDKICQAVFVPILHMELIEKDSLGNEDRGGFGSTFHNAFEGGGDNARK